MEEDANFSIPTADWRQRALAGLPPQLDGGPHVPVYVRSLEGLWLVLGSDEWENMDVPDIKIERRPHGWLIFLHPHGMDPTGYVCLLDDGRTFAAPQGGVKHPLQMVKNEEEFPGLDDP